MVGAPIQRPQEFTAGCQGSGVQQRASAELALICRSTPSRGPFIFNFSLVCPISCLHEQMKPCSDKVLSSQFAPRGSIQDPASRRTDRGKGDTSMMRTYEDLLEEIVNMAQVLDFCRTGRDPVALQERIWPAFEEARPPRPLLARRVAEDTLQVICT